MWLKAQEDYHKQMIISKLRYETKIADMKRPKGFLGSHGDFIATPEPILEAA